MADSASETVKLRNEVTVNGVKYPAGVKIEVPKGQAADLERIDDDHTTYKENLMKKRTFEVDGGTIAMGGGAE